MGRLDGKVAFITGAGSGIARSAARIFTQEGAKVAIAELKPELGRETERLVRDAGGGAIVNMSSVVALRGSFPIHVYTAAKGGVIAFTQVLAGTYAKDKIRANAICPGVIMTDRVRQRLGVDRPQTAGQSGVVNLESQLKKYPFSVGEPEDIARVALFLASDEARMMTGAIVPVDGGLSAY